jgi:hypothetical protein
MAETEPGINPETYLDNVLLWRPPLPVDRVDISDIEALAAVGDATEPGYAWERLPRWLAEIEATFKRADDVPVVHFDICSSLPLNVQMMRALEFKRSAERANDRASCWLF